MFVAASLCDIHIGWTNFIVVIFRSANEAG
jgi:hypothetical protein